MDDLHTTPMLESVHATQPRTLAGRYRLIRPIGAGGMAVVWEARDLALGRSVAVKVPSNAAPGLGADRSSTDAIVREARLAARVNHPGITAVFDVGVADERPFIVMELVEGPTLASVLSSGALGATEAVRIAAAVADALAALHRDGVVHGDVKPANVLLAPDGRPKLSDLGIGSFVDRSAHSETRSAERDVAGSDRTTRRYGTLPYAAPEVRRGAAPSPASDVFALGVMLGEMGIGASGAPEDVVAAGSAAMATDPRSRPSAASIAGALAALDATAAGAMDRTQPLSHVAPTASFAAATDALAGGTTVLPAVPAVPSVVPGRAGRIGLAILAAVLVTAVAIVVGLSILAAGHHGVPTPPTSPRTAPSPTHAVPATAPSPQSPPSPSDRGHGKHHRHRHGHGGD